MTFRLLRHTAWPALCSAALASACSSKPATADAFVSASLQPGGSGMCSIGFQSTIFEIGVATGTQPNTVKDGGSQAGGQVSVSCTVHPDNGGYDLSLFAELHDQGAMQLNSTSPVMSSGGQGVVGSFTKTVGTSSGQTFTANDCSISFTYMQEPVPNAAPIAGGRIWAHVSCQDAVGNSSFLLPDGGSTNQVCDAEADFLFENCGS
jgi:hypothetical protein